MDTFLRIEQPAEPGAPAGPAADAQPYASIGEFYAAIEEGLRTLGTEEVFAEARRSRPGCQVPPRYYYGGAGRLIEVTDLASALDALDEIVREGEGLPVGTLTQTVADYATQAAAAGGARAHGVDDGDVLPYGWKMYSHYARFREIREGRRYRPTQLVADRPAGDVLPVEWAAVLPAAADPKARHVKGTAAWAPMVECDLTYSDLVDTLYRAYNGEPQALQSAVTVM